MATSRRIRQSLSTVLATSLLSFLSPMGVAAEDAVERAGPGVGDSAARSISVLARQLTDALDQGRQAAEAEPPQPTVLQQRSLDGARGAFQRAHQSARRFSEAVERGADRDESEWLFKNVEDQLRQGVETAREAERSPAMRAAIDRINGIMSEIAQQFGESE